MKTQYYIHRTGLHHHIIVEFCFQGDLRKNVCSQIEHFVCNKKKPQIEFTYVGVFILLIS